MLKACLFFYLVLIWHSGFAVDAASTTPAAQLIEKFKNSEACWRQFEAAEKIVALHDTNVLQSPILMDGLTNDDRHARANAAYVFDRLGDERGFDTLEKILTDRSSRPVEYTDDAMHPSLRLQIEADRYYAVHLFGDLKDPRAVPILIPLLNDDGVNYIVPWSLGQIGDKRAIPPLIATLSDTNPSVRVLAIYALEQLHAVAALPRLRQLLNDHDRTNFGALVTVADAADEAIIELKPPQDAIDRLDADLTSSSGIWLNGFPTGIVSLPATAAVQEVVSRVIAQADFGGIITNYQIVESRQVNIPQGSIPDHYLMVLVKTNRGEKIVVMRYSNGYKGWWHRVYDADGPPYLRYY